MANGSGRSAWFYIGSGCGIIVVLALIGLGTIVFIGSRSVRQFKKDMRDPAARTAKARHLLGTEEIPEGYYAGVGFSLPFILDMAMLVDQPPEPDGGISRDTERMFIYVKLRRGGGDWERYIEGQADPMELLDDQGFRFRGRDLIGRDEFAVDDLRVVYTSHRGNVATGGGRNVDGLVSFMFMICPGDKKKRIGVWTGPDPARERPVSEIELDGTVADPEAMRRFLSHFDFCGA